MMQRKMQCHALGIYRTCRGDVGVGRLDGRDELICGVRGRCGGWVMRVEGGWFGW
jgi:hypothetical protein